MNLSDTPATGANETGGYSIDEAANRIAGLLDTADEDGATHEDEADVETPSDEDGDAPLETDADVDAEQPSDEDSSETDGDEAGEEDADETEPKASAVTDETEVDFGNGEKVTVRELKDGYLRHADYTRKTQETAAERTQYETARTETIKNLYTFREHAWGALGLEAMHSPEEMQAMLDEDPGEYVRTKAKIEQRNAIIGEINRRIVHLEGEAARIAEETHAQAKIDGQRKLVEIRPELRTEAGLADRLGTFLLSTGIPRELIEAETNPLLFSLALDAMRFREGQTSAATVKAKIEAKPALVKPGASTRTTAPRSELAKAKSRLSKSGSLDDAAEVLKHLL